MNRTALLLAGVVAGAALLVSTGAVPFQSSGTDEIPDASIEMQPAEGPNGDYAVLNGDGEIELLLTEANPDIEGAGINEDTVTPIDRVFTITYTGDDAAEVWITDDADDVRFFRGDDPDDSIEGSDNSVALTADQTIAVGVLVDTRGGHDVESADNFTVHATVPEESAGGETTETSASGSPGQDETDESTAQDTPTGESDGSDDGTDVGTLGESDAVGVRVVDASLSASTAAPGESVTATAVVENPTSVAVTVDTSLLVDGTAVAGTEVTVPTGGRRVVTFEMAVDEPGTYEVDVQGVAVSPEIGSDADAAGTLVVEATPTPSPPGDVGTSPNGPAGTPTVTEPPANGSEPQADVVEVGTPAPEGEVANAGPRLAIEEPLGVGLCPLASVLAGLSLVVAALRVWRWRTGWGRDGP